MPLSWNEIRDRALAFSREWADESSEDAEAKSFWDGFFNVFGISRKRVASFEEPVKKLGDRQGFIDLFWKGVLLVEHKSRGKDLVRAYTQALDYFPGIKERDLPKYVLVSDFARLRLHDLETGEETEFPLADFHQHIRLFGFIAGYQSRVFKPEDPVNVQAAERMGKLHDQLKAIGYDGHPLEVYLVRLLFCLFAEDTTIFDKAQFQDYIEQRTGEDGSDLAHHLATLFHILNTPENKRLKNLDEQLAAFPYVNGKLFEEMLPPASFDTAMREALLDCCAIDWSRISPAVFGSLFQSIMDAKARRNLGAHYTRETNILKLIGPLFLDGLRVEFVRIKTQPKKLVELHQRIAKLTFFDPACGCGNFLVIAYRELRLLELDILRALYNPKKGAQIDVGMLLLDVDRFYGIEIEEFPAQIAQVALWLTDHQMNQRVSEEFGQYFRRLPLKKSAAIVHGNALRLDWRAVCPQADYVLGNPPFIGKQHQTPAQKDDLSAVFAGLKGVGVLDYVTCWYRKAVDYMADTPATRTALVSTNSITQGEQVGVLWPDLFARGVKIHFAHRTFQWSSEARGKAAVHCVIVGFALHDANEKWLFDYETPQGEPHAIRAQNINPYLVAAADLVLENRRQPICKAPPCVFGSMPNDGGHLLLDLNEKRDLLAREPSAKPWIRPLLGSEEFINGVERWCLWLEGISPSELKALPAVLERVDAVRKQRAASNRETTRALAATPTLFGENRQPRKRYLLVPAHSSENRAYVPTGYISPDVICGNANFAIPDASVFHFGVLTSTMHNAWMRAVCGRLESRYRYSAGIVYNNFPWPEPTDKQRATIETAAQAVLDTRAQFPKATLADLYDPLTMPPALVKAHQVLDRAVDAAYLAGTPIKSFASEAERVAFLFERYQALTSLLPSASAKGKRVSRKSASKNALESSGLE